MNETVAKKELTIFEEITNAFYEERHKMFDQLYLIESILDRIEPMDSMKEPIGEKEDDCISFVDELRRFVGYTHVANNRLENILNHLKRLV